MTNELHEAHLRDERRHRRSRALRYAGGVCMLVYLTVMVAMLATAMLMLGHFIISRAVDHELDRMTPPATVLATPDDISYAGES